MADIGGQMEQNTTEGHVLDAKGVAKTFRISKNEVYRLVHAGVLPALRFGKQGRTLRFLKEDILKLKERSNP